jgi:hypothetical protein
MKGVRPPPRLDLAGAVRGDLLEPRLSLETGEALFSPTNKPKDGGSSPLVSRLWGKT